MKEQYWETSGITSIYVRATLRILQFLFALIIAILYGIDLAFASSTSTSAQSAWVFAEVAAALSLITCMLHCFVTIKRVLWCLWDWVLVILWAAQTGVFGTIFIKQAVLRPDYLIATTSISRMRAAVWVALVNMLLWLFTTVLGMVWCCSARSMTRKVDKEELEVGQADEEHSLEMRSVDHNRPRSS